MKLIICGSAAAEGIPAIFCECEICAEARKRGGKDIRLRATYSIGGKTHVDFGPDILSQDYKYNLELQNLENLFFTHSHPDHLHVFEFEMRRNGFSRVGSVLNVYGNDAVLACIRQNQFVNENDCKMKFNRLSVNQQVQIPDQGLEFTALAASHVTSEEALLFSVRGKKAKIFIGNDTGWFPDGTWDFLKGNRHDIFIIDATCGSLDVRTGHMSAGAVADTVRELKKTGAADSKTLFVANHFSHNGKMLHEDFEKYFEPYGIQVGFDGMALDF